MLTVFCISLRSSDSLDVWTLHNSVIAKKKGIGVLMRQLLEGILRPHLVLHSARLGTQCNKKLNRCDARTQQFQSGLRLMSVDDLRPMLAAIGIPSAKGEDKGKNKRLPN